ncbi:hypothetical protein M1432_00015 [Patescibacteria group bacterium]|nr:hypothetical protein [Patescibacteria group bacterium]
MKFCPCCGELPEGEWQTVCMKCRLPFISGELFFHKTACECNRFPYGKAIAESNDLRKEIPEMLSAIGIPDIERPEYYRRVLILNSR